LTLVHIRRAHSHFPIRPYLPQLVAALEDGDAHVRDCARPSVIELFTGPGVSDAARADLKKEMSKKGVRKTIVDGVLSKLITTNTAVTGGLPSDGSDNGDVPSTSGPKSTGYIPPSLRLQNQKQTAEAANATAGPSGVSRTASTTGAKGASRPASRAAMVEPPTPGGENVDVKPVYVSFHFCTWNVHR
jgi:CLIP-associating protein 1/2